MGHLAGTIVTPEPEKDNSGRYTYTAGGRYSFSFDFYPIFRFIANTGSRGLEKGGLSLFETDTRKLSMDDLRSLLQEPIATKHSAALSLVSDASMGTQFIFLYEQVCND